MTTPLNCEIIETGDDITASVIWLHGLGASGHDFVPIVPHLQLPADVSIRFIFPHAPSIPVTVNGGMMMPAWYDILAMELERKIDEDQILASAAKIHELIDQEIERGIASDRIILAGFSQGGAVCYQAALSYAKPLGALLAMSTYFATYRTINIHSANANLPVHIFHGSQDVMVQEVMGQQACDLLRQKGFDPTYQHYPMAHEVCMDEINDIAAQLKAHLS